MSQRKTVALVLVMGCALAACEPRYESLDKLAPGILLEPAPEGAATRVPLRAVTAKSLQLTKVSEGFVSKLYHDAAGYCTIAYGHLVRKGNCDGTETPEFRAGLSEPRGAELLVVDMRSAQLAVQDAVTVPLTDGQYGALCDFVFNAGGAAFRKSTLLRLINASQFDGVPAQLRRWVLAGGRKWPGLVTRREREIELFFDGLPMPSASPDRSLPLDEVDIRSGEP